MWFQTMLRVRVLVSMQTRRVEKLMLEKSFKAQYPPVSVVWSFGEVSSSSLDHGSKFGGPSPKALLQLNSATFVAR
ncbi:hypothetical protein TNCV_2131111 [Trichonephila clavipes]|nr:hypothetical protein TNCV_2131111 [Trichonephila clavipes]